MGTDKLASSIDYAQQLVDDRAAAAATAGAATYSTNATPVVGLNANFDASYVAYNASTVTQAGSSYTVNDGDSLASIALSVWGDASLWYVIADANGLEADANLVAGQSLILPDKVVNLHNTSQTFKPYNPNDALGDTTPTLPKEPQPPAPKKQGCGGIGQILVAIVAIAVTAIVLPWATDKVAVAVLGATAGTTTAAIVGGTIAGAIGGIASQTFAVGTGIQSKFNWAAVATAAIGGGVGGAFAQGSGFIGAVTHGMVTNAVTQGVSMAVGLQKKFDWTSVAVAGVASGVASEVGGWLKGAKTDAATGKVTYGSPRVSGEIAQSVIVGTASLLASAATKSLITGQDFGKSIREALPDAIASTVGNMIGEALIAEIQDSKSNRASELKIKPKTADDDPVLDTEKLGPSQYFDVDTTMPELPTLVRDGGAAEHRSHNANLRSKNTTAKTKASLSKEYHSTVYSDTTAVSIDPKDGSLNSVSQGHVLTSRSRHEKTNLESRVSSDKKHIEYRLCDVGTTDCSDWGYYDNLSPTSESYLEFGNKWGYLVATPRSKDPLDRFKLAFQQGFAESYLNDGRSYRDMFDNLITQANAIGKHPESLLVMANSIKNQAPAEIANFIRRNPLGGLSMNINAMRSFYEVGQQTYADYKIASTNGTLAEFFGYGLGHVTPTLMEAALTEGGSVTISLGRNMTRIGGKKFLFNSADNVIGSAAERVVPTGALNPGAKVAGDGLGIFADRSVTITPKGLDLVSGHLSQFDDFAPNQMMLQRLQTAADAGVPVTGADAIFYTHEAAEATMMGRGMSYDAAHAAALEKYGVSPYSVYHPDVIQASPGTFNSNWHNFWKLNGN